MDKGLDELDYSQEKEDEVEILPKINSWHPEKEKMRLAYWVLGGIFMVFMLAIIADGLSKKGYLDTGLSASLFELCKTGMLPIVTLILGYYFSKN